MLKRNPTPYFRLTFSAQELGSLVGVSEQTVLQWKHCGLLLNKAPSDPEPQVYVIQHCFEIGWIKHLTRFIDLQKIKGIMEYLQHPKLLRLYHCSFLLLFC